MNKEEIKAAIFREIEEANANISLLVENFNTKETLISYHEDHQVVSASMIKVPIMLTALELVQEGLLSTDTLLEIQALDILDDTEVFEYGQGNYMLDELLVWMIINSDNTATNCLIDYITMDRINDFCRIMTLHNTKLERKMLDFKAIELGRNNYTSASDMKVLFHALYNKTILTPALCEYAVSILKRQRHKQNSLRYIKDAVTVAHKTGGLDFLNHDAGIFYLEHTDYYFGAFVTEAPDDDYGKRWIGRVSKLVYEYYLLNSNR